MCVCHRRCTTRSRNTAAATGRTPVVRNYDDIDDGTRVTRTRHAAGAATPVVDWQHNFARVTTPSYCGGQVVKYLHYKNKNKQTNKRTSHPASQPTHGPANQFAYPPALVACSCRSGFQIPMRRTTHTHTHTNGARSAQRAVCSESRACDRVTGQLDNIQNRIATRSAAARVHDVRSGVASTPPVSECAVSPDPDPVATDRHTASRRAAYNPFDSHARARASTTSDTLVFDSIEPTKPVYKIQNATIPSDRKNSLQHYVQYVSAAGAWK